MNAITEQELDLLSRVKNGLTNAEIGEQVGAKQNVIKMRLRVVFLKLGVNNRTKAVVRAQAEGLIA